MNGLASMGRAATALSIAVSLLGAAPALGAQQASGYVVRSVEPSNLAMSPPELPDISGYTLSLIHI